MAVNKKGIFGVVKKEFTIEPFNGNGHDLFSAHKIEGCIGLVEQGLSFQGFETDNFKAAGAGDAELRSQKVDGGGLRGYVELLSLHQLRTKAQIQEPTLNGFRASWPLWNILLRAGLLTREVVSLGSKTLIVVDIPDILAEHTRCLPMQTPALKKLA